MKKTITFALIAIALTFLAWQTFDLKAQLGTMRSLSNQQSKSQQSIQESINDLAAAVKSGLAKQPDKTEDEVVQDETEYFTDDGSGERLDTMEGALADLKDQIEDLTQSINATNQQSVAFESKAAQEQKAEFSKPKLSPEQRAQLQQDRINQIEQIVNDPAQYDSVWSPQTQQKIDKIITEKPELSVATSTNTQCGSTVCRVKATLPSNLTALEKDIFNWTLTMSMGQDLPTSTFNTIGHPDGSQELTFYFARQGHSLPASVE